MLGLTLNLSGNGGKEDRRYRTLSVIRIMRE